MPEMNSLFELSVYVCIFILHGRGNGLSIFPVGGIDGSNLFECGQSASFNCLSPEAPFNVILKVNDTVAVTCFLASCTPGSAAPSEYTYTHNITGSLVTAHKNSLTINDERTTFKCEKGTQSLSLSPKIKVYPANDTSHMTIQGSLVTVKTGCTKLDNGLTFRWYKTKNKDGSQDDFLENSTNPTIDNTFCIPSDHCEGNGFSITYTIDHDPNGSPFYIKCIVHVSEDNRQDVILISNSTVYLKDITTTNISPSKTTVTPPSSVSKSSTSEMKTTTTTSRENANSSLSTTLSTTTTSNAQTSVHTRLTTTSEEPRKSDQEKLILVYVFAPLGSVIVIVIIIYVICINFRKEKANETNTTTIPTISTTTSASSSTSSSIDHFTRSKSTVTGKEQTQNADKTSTILIIAFSSIAGIALLMIVVFAINKIRKRRMKQSGTSSTHEMKTDMNKQ